MADWRDEEERVDVILVEHGPRKITVIKILRDLLGLGLTEGKDFIESLPRVVKTDLSLDEGCSLRDRFEQAGAAVHLKTRPPR
jgi:large subunit ribosomal protein L7/L12